MTSQPFSGIATFGRRPYQPSPSRLDSDGKPIDVAILGIPFDGSVSYRSGTRLGPRAIREQSLLLWGYNHAQGVNPFDALSIVDAGDLDAVPVDIRQTHALVTEAAAAWRKTGAIVLGLGGEHSITLPLLRAAAAAEGEPLAVVHVDAHGDTWNEEYPGHPYSHGTPFVRAFDEKLISPAAYFQIGIRGPTYGPEDYEDARRLGARIITADDVAERGITEVIAEVRLAIGSRPLYLSFDIDAVDPAFAPGTGTPEVAGLTSREALQLVRGLAGLKIVGADVVEVSPPYDTSGITAILAANLAYEMLCLIARRPTGSFREIGYHGAGVSR